MEARLEPNKARERHNIARHRHNKARQKHNKARQMPNKGITGLTRPLIGLEKLIIGLTRGPARPITCVTRPHQGPTVSQHAPKLPLFCWGLLLAATA